MPNLPGTPVYLRIEPGHSLILRTFEHLAISGPTWSFVKPAKKLLELAGPWNVEFLSGGPVLPKPYQTDRLESWTTNGDAETERFAGTARYRTHFDLPVRTGGASIWDVSLFNTARVRLNGQDLGALIMNPYRVELRNLKPTGNLLEVEVTNLSANRIRDRA